MFNFVFTSRIYVQLMIEHMKMRICDILYIVIIILLSILSENTISDEIK